MKRLPQVIYMSPEEIDALVKQRETDAASIPLGEARLSILKEIARLRMYADAKRWIESPGLKSGA